MYTYNMLVYGGPQILQKATELSDTKASALAMNRIVDCGECSEC